jgi:hypothetical protein
MEGSKSRQASSSPFSQAMAGKLRKNGFAPKILQALSHPAGAVWTRSMNSRSGNLYRRDLPSRLSVLLGAAQ